MGQIWWTWLCFNEKICQSQSDRHTQFEKNGRAWELRLWYLQEYRSGISCSKNTTTTTFYDSSRKISIWSKAVGWNRLRRRSFYLFKKNIEHIVEILIIFYTFYSLPLSGIKPGPGKHPVGENCYPKTKRPMPIEPPAKKICGDCGQRTGPGIPHPCTKIYESWN